MTVKIVIIFEGNVSPLRRTQHIHNEGICVPNWRAMSFGPGFAYSFASIGGTDIPEVRTVIDVVVTFILSIDSWSRLYIVNALWSAL